MKKNEKNNNTDDIHIEEICLFSGVDSQEPAPKDDVKEKPIAQKSFEQKSIEQKSFEQKPFEQKSIEQKPIEQKSFEQKPFTTTVSDNKNFNFFSFLQKEESDKAQRAEKLVSPEKVALDEKYKTGVNNERLSEKRSKSDTLDIFKRNDTRPQYKTFGNNDYEKTINDLKLELENTKQLKDNEIRKQNQMFLAKYGEVEKQYLSKIQAYKDENTTLTDRNKILKDTYDKTKSENETLKSELDKVKTDSRPGSNTAIEVFLCLSVVIAMFIRIYSQAATSDVSTFMIGLFIPNFTLALIALIISFNIRKKRILSLLITLLVATNIYIFF